MWKEYIDSVVEQEVKQRLSYFQPANSKKLNSVERKLGVTIHDSLASFLRESNGLLRDNKVIIFSAHDIIKHTLQVRNSMPRKQYPEVFKGHIFFSTTNNTNDHFSIKHDIETNRELVYVWESHNIPGCFMSESLEKWLKVWLSVDRNRYYRGPQHLQEFGRPVTSKIQKYLSSELSDFKKEYCWQKQITCSCNSNDFKLFYYGSLLEGGGIADTEEFRQREEIECQECHKRLVLFDAHQHGYDPVVCNFPDTPKDEYSQREIDLSYSCECGNNTFHFVATASYDSSFYDIVDLETQRELDECYGWFTVKAICSECKKISP